MSLLDNLNGIPPSLLLALGTRSGRTLSLAELSEVSGVPLRSIARMAVAPDWSVYRQLVLLSDIAEACGVDMFNQGDARKRIKRMAVQAKVPFSSLSAGGVARFSRERRRQRVLRAMLPRTDSKL